MKRRGAKSKCCGAPLKLAADLPADGRTTHPYWKCSECQQRTVVIKDE